MFQELCNLSAAWHEACAAADFGARTLVFFVSVILCFFCLMFFDVFWWFVEVLDGCFEGVLVVF